MESSRQYFLTNSQFQPILRAGFMQIDHADQLPVGDAYVRTSDTEAVLRLSYPAAKVADSAMVAVHMFKLPAGEAEFRRICEWYGERKKRTRLPEGVAFEPTHLAVQEAPPSWQHDAWVQSKADIIHTYQTATRAMLVRMMGTKAAMLTHPLLSMVQQHMRIREDKGETTLPETQTKPGSQPTFTDAPIDDTVREEILQAVDRAYSYLGLAPDTTPQAIQQSIFEKVDAIRTLADKAAGAEIKTVAIDLGALWGQSLCKATGWEWRSLKQSDGTTFTAACSPSRSHMVNPILNLHSLLKSKPNGKANNSLLLFNMVCENHLPAVPNGTLLALG